MTIARDPARRSCPVPVPRPGAGRKLPGHSPLAKRAANPDPGPLPASAGGIPFPQPRHHGMQTAQASAIQDQASARASRIRAEHIGRLRRHQARHSIGQLHLQMRHPVHVPHRIGPQPAPMQRMRHRRDHDLARQQGTETS